MPAGWKFATALTPAGGAPPAVSFAPVSLETLVDSPVMIGEYFRSNDLTPGARPGHTLNLVADSADGAGVKAPDRSALRRLVPKTERCSARAITALRFFAVAERRCFRIRTGASSIQRPAAARNGVQLRPDYRNMAAYSCSATNSVHSWNGKYRRPAGMATPDYKPPMKGDLLWIYEGLTQYIGEMIAVRAGLRTAEDYREELAWVGGYLDNRPGRSWRSLEDTAVSAPSLYDVSTTNWTSWRRGLDFYDEGWLIWLEADMVIRGESHGQRSLDEFLPRVFRAAEQRSENGSLHAG